MTIGEPCHAQATRCRMSSLQSCGFRSTSRPFLYGVFTLALAELGDRFSGSLLLAGNAAFALMWGVGGLIGPPTVGAAMNFIDPEGFPITLGLSYAMLTALIVTNMIRTKRAG